MNNILNRTRCNNGTSVASGTRSHVNNKVCLTHRILVMLHDDQSITKVPQPFQGFQQFIVIALV